MLNRLVATSLCLFLLLGAQAGFGQAPAAKPAEAAEPAPPVADYYPPEDDFDRKGFYLGLAAQFALELFDKSPDGTFGVLNQSDTWGVNGRIGYRFHPHIAAEVNIDWLEDFEFEVKGNRMRGDVQHRLEGLSVMPSLKGFFLTGRYQPYLIVSPGLMWMQLKRSGAFFNENIDDRLAFAVRGGPGIDIYIFRNLLVNAEAFYVYPTGDMQDYPYLGITFGGQFRF